MKRIYEDSMLSRLPALKREKILKKRKADGISRRKMRQENLEEYRRKVKSQLRHSSNQRERYRSYFLWFSLDLYRIPIYQGYLKMNAPYVGSNGGNVIG